jgi:hypothetical protein
MPELIINPSGETRSVEDLRDIFEAFKASGMAMPRSRLDYRTQKNIVASQFWFDLVQSFAKRGKEFPERGTPAYDRKIDEIWKTEPILCGTVYGMMAKAQTRTWQIEGGRTNARRAAKMLVNAKHSYWKSGWWGFAGVSSLDFHTTRLGTMWGALRRGSRQYGSLVGLEHIDTLSCYLTGSISEPVRYESAETGQTIRYKPGEIINLTSMALSRESALGSGLCAVERALQAARILILLHNYDEEKLLNMPPEGIASVSGLTQDEFLDSVALWQEQRKQSNSLTFPQVLWLLSQQPGQNVSVDLTTFSSMPEQFNRESVVTQYVNTLANAFGVSASDIWFMGGGPFGTGKETELQHSYARGKGEGEWFSVTTQTINEELPEDVTFSYDTQDIEEDLNAAQTAQAWVNALSPLMQQAETLEISGDEWKQLLVSKGVLPEWMGKQAENTRTIITSSDAPNMTKEKADEIVTFMYKLGRLQMYERPSFKINAPLLKQQPSIRGKPLPEKEGERGARVTKKTIESEMQVWGEIPELRQYVDAQGETSPDASGGSEQS